MRLHSPRVGTALRANAEIDPRPLTLLVAVTLGTIIAVGSSHAEACEFALTNPRPGVLSGSEQPSGYVPRNVAFVTADWTPLRSGTSDQWVVAKLESGEEVVAVEVPGTRVSASEGVVKPNSLLPEDTVLNVFRWSSYSDTTFRTTADIDEVSPSRPEVARGTVSFHDGTGACQSDSCGDYTSLSIELKETSSDDLASPDQLVYVLYVGSSAQEVATKTQATSLHQSSAIFDHRLWQLVADEWLERDVYVAVAALDQAGNLSERSLPVRIHSGDSDGCSVKQRYGRGSFARGVFFLALALYWMRHSVSPGRTAPAPTRPKAR